MDVRIFDSTPSGTTAERDAAYPSPDGGQMWDNIDVGYRQIYNAASGAWEKDQQYTNGAAHIGFASTDSITYTDGTYDYDCEAAPGTSLSATSWRISRSQIASPYRVEYAGNGGFSYAATDLATVQGHFA